ncbi:response regulator transcription factor [Scatolibacter rhodanostii]|uniref:response regulator transcription factor n=1 Tax=Scatolibacter rhodanostii TaxID=2014781 RepID=UPI000C07FADF|nr:response regulator transcription factor [Scatolibacter rhodanostii]
MYKILLVEDDMTIAKTVEKHLMGWGLSVSRIEDFAHVLERFVEFQPQLVLMDISLPFFNGYHWCTEIRRLSRVPIIFLSSASENMNIVMAINVGADDFIAKPFDLDVLTAKVQAVLRRTYDFAGETNLLQHKGVVLNMSNTTLVYENETLNLTKNEYKILQTLFENKGHAVSRETLMTKLWESDNFVDENSLTVNVTRLRRKLEEIGIEKFIQTKKGIGYMLEE